jgi:hypothetical protein
MTGREEAAGRWDEQPMVAHSTVVVATAGRLCATVTWTKSPNRGMGRAANLEWIMPKHSAICEAESPSRVSLGLNERDSDILRQRGVTVCTTRLS